MYKIRIDRHSPRIRIFHIDRNVVIKNVDRRIVIRGKQKRGLPGAGDKNYVQSFTNSSLITVIHNLGKRPAISIEDTAGDEVEGDVEYVDINTIIVKFSSSFSGRVICN